MKILTFLCLAVSFSVISCSKDDAQIPPKVDIKAQSLGVQIKSDSKIFMGQEIDKPIAGNGDLFYDEDKGCFLKIQEGVVADCMLKTKVVYKITVDCLKNKKLLSIDGIVCGEKIESQSSYKKLCSNSTIADGYYLRKNNSFYWLDQFSQVTKMGLIVDDESLREEGENPYSLKNCNDVKTPISSKPSDLKKSSSQPYSQICEIAKGNAITKCLNMPSGASGMASCNEAVGVANNACKRTDLTILGIMEEASKGASK